jgi:hypothetical protein
MHFTILGPMGGWVFHVAVQLALLAFVADRLSALRNGGEGPQGGAASGEGGPSGIGPAAPGQKDPGPKDFEPNNPEPKDPAPAGASLDSSFSEGLPDAAKWPERGLEEQRGAIGPSLAKSPRRASGGLEEDLEGKPLFSRPSSWLLMLAALFFDLVHLVSGGRHYSIEAFPGTDFGFYPMVWAPFACCLAFGALMSAKGGSAFKRAFPVFAAVAAHLALTALGQDLFAARAQALVLLFWAFIFGRGFWPRAMALVLAAAYFPAERCLTGTEAFAALSPLDWLSPLSGPALALDMALKEAAFQSSGLWGLGPKYLSRLDFVAPGMMRLNALPYLTVAAGRGGLLIYSVMVLSLLLAMAWLAVKTRSDSEVCSLMPAWLLLAANQYLAFILFLGWRSSGLTHPPAFLGGAGTGQEMLLFALLAVPFAARDAKGGPPGGPPLPKGGRSLEAGPE